MLGLSSSYKLIFSFLFSDRPEGGVSQENTSKGKENFFPRRMFIGGDAAEDPTKKPRDDNRRSRELYLPHTHEKLLWAESGGKR